MKIDEMLSVSLRSNEVEREVLFGLFELLVRMEMNT